MKKLHLTIILIATATLLMAQSKISENLWEKILEAQETGSSVETIIFLEGKYDILSLDKQLKEQKATPHERAVKVNTELRHHANLSQKSLVEILESKASTEVIQYKTFWITNAIFIDANPGIIIELAKHPDIANLEAIEKLEPIKPLGSKPANKMPGHAEPGLKVINAHKMWKLGFTGEGVVVANIDSGVEGDHPALQSSWRGNNVPPEQAWFDPTWGSIFPTDNSGHGSRTMGIMVGLESENNDTIGVAMNAEWIAARSSYSVATDLLCLEWLFDPDANPETTDDMPDVINNSWAIGSQCSEYFLEAITNIEMAGVAMVHAAGNDGPGPGTIINPADLNVSNMTAFSVGAVVGYHEDLIIADFSSRGPTPCTAGTGDSIKPEVVAPGFWIRSSRLSGSYTYSNGTSYAAPHVAGAIALLKQAFPNKTGNELKQMLYENARDLGVAGEDNTYGMGVIDVYKAYFVNQFPGTPKHPGNFTAYSDYLSPSSVNLTWTDPVELVGGGALVNFEIRIWRNNEFLTSISPDEEMYSDEGLTDGQNYQYEIFSFDLDTDSLSLGVVTSVYCGGSPVPAQPENINATYDELTGVTITWSDPATQIDGTPLDDLDKIYVYHNEEWIAEVGPGQETYNYNSSCNNNSVHFYTLRAVDNESPLNMSDVSDWGTVYIGDHPEILIWEGPGVSGPAKGSGDSLLQTISLLNPDVYLTNSLYEFGNNLNIYNSIFIVLGVFPYNHILPAGYGNALEMYLQEGGNIYVEGGVCYNNDPYVGGYNIRSWFNLNEGAIGDCDVFYVDGMNDIEDLVFDYKGVNIIMDELAPLNSTSILKNSENSDILGVWWDGFGNNGAKTIGVVPSYGGLVDTTGSCFKEYLMCRYLNYMGYEYDCDSILEYCNINVKIPRVIENDSQYLFSVSPVPIVNVATIKYKLIESTPLLIEIYNLQGKRTYTLVNDFQLKGAYFLKLDASELTAGIYFCTLKTNNGIRTKKIIKL